MSDTGSKKFLSYAERKEVENRRRLENNRSVTRSYNLVRTPPPPPPPPPAHPYPQPALPTKPAQVLCFFTRADVTDKYK